MAERVDELARAPSLGKINLIVFLVIGFLLFLLVVIILGWSVPFWVYGLAILVIIIVIVATLYTRKSGQEASWKKKIPKLLTARNILLAIAILLLAVIIWNNVPSRVYSAQELKNFTVGNCNVQGERLIYMGPFSVTIPDPAGLSGETTIGGLTVNPGRNPIIQLDASVGTYPGVYLVKYGQGGNNMADFGNSACGLAKSVDGTPIISHHAMIYYDGIARLLSCVAVPVLPGMAALPLYFGTNWMRVVPSFWIFYSDPVFWVGWNGVSSSSINEDPKALMRYPVIISSQQGAWETTDIGSIDVMR